MRYKYKIRKYYRKRNIQNQIFSILIVWNLTDGCSNFISAILRISNVTDEICSIIDKYTRYKYKVRRNYWKRNIQDQIFSILRIRNLEDSCSNFISAM